MIDSMKAPGRALYVTYSTQVATGAMNGRTILHNCRAPVTTGEIRYVEDIILGTCERKLKANNLFLTWWNEIEGGEK